MIRVIIADDHDLVRQSLKFLLTAQDDIQVVGEACDGQEAVDLTLALKPDVLILDLSMPGVNGIDSTRQIRIRNRTTRILILTMHNDESIIRRAFRSGANGFLSKRSNTVDMLSAIRSIVQNEYYLSPELKKNINLEQILSFDEENEFNDTLTPREREICKLICEGKTNQAISRLLKISIKTVEKHRANLMEKLGVQDMASLIRVAIQQAIIMVEK